MPGPDRRPSWWGPDWLGFPLAFWLSVLTGAAITWVIAAVLLSLLDPSLFTPYGTVSGQPGPRFAGDLYATLASAVGALPPLLLWSRALHRRGLHSWDDD
jgi:hypothetical protein